MTGIDITKLAQSLKAAAEKATPGRIGDRTDGSGSIKYRCFGNDGSLVLQTDHKNMEYGFIGPNAEADELFFRECAPGNILALVEALEKAQQRNGELEQKHCGGALTEREIEHVEVTGKLISEIDIRDKCIDELEENHAQVIQSRDHYKRMSEEGLKQLAESRTVTVRLPDISSKAFWSSNGKTEVFHPETYKRWVKEAIERHCAIARIEVEVK